MIIAKLSAYGAIVSLSPEGELQVTFHTVETFREEFNTIRGQVAMKFIESLPDHVRKQVGDTQ
jgi:hypothetical protein